MGITRTDPSTHPITLREAKAYLRIDSSDEDAIINDLIGVATENAQQFTSRQFVTATYTWTRDEFPDDNAPLYVPRGPLKSVTSIKYDDTQGSEQTLSASDYIVSTSHTVGRISLAENKSWPVTQAQADAVRIEFEAGYDTVPAPIRNAIKMLVANWYEHREPMVVGTIATALPLSVESLLWPYRVMEVA